MTLDDLGNLGDLIGGIDLRQRLDQPEGRAGQEGAAADTERRIQIDVKGGATRKAAPLEESREVRMGKKEGPTYDGSCTCGSVRYRMTSEPLFVHCCHCRWCQRETGSAFALNAMIEAERVVLLAGTPEVVLTPSNSGKGQKISRCPACRVALWSNYAGAGDSVHFVRVGTLLEPDRLPPDIHIFTSSKQPWVVLPPDTPAVAEFYDRNSFWPQASLERRQELLAKLQPKEG